MKLLFIVIFWINSLTPNRNPTDVYEIATAITRTVLADRPLFLGDESREKTASLFTAIGFRESSLRPKAKSKTNDHCLMQINNRPDLIEDLDKCLEVAMTKLRESMRMCRDPIAFYAEGPRGCTSDRAIRISKDRMAMADMLVRKAKAQQ